MGKVLEGTSMAIYICGIYYSIYTTNQIVTYVYIYISMGDLQDPKMEARKRTIFWAIFWRDIPWNLGLKNRPFVYGRYLHFRILEFPLITDWSNQLAGNIESNDLTSVFICLPDFFGHIQSTIPTIRYM